MMQNKKKPVGLSHATDELRKLILENPDLPMLVFASDDANSGDYSWMTCTSVRAKVGEFLDCKQEANDEIVYTDRSDFEEDLEEHLFDSRFDGNDAEFEALLAEKLSDYEPYWTKCIIVYVGN